MTSLHGWGRYPVEPCRLFRPEKRSSLAAILSSGLAPHYISRGLGRSYGDAALNRDGGVISHLRLNRFLSFDPGTGVLECEGGVSFAEIVETFLPRGFFPPVTPGTRFVTVGGAIACDVHGKNHHRDGSIARHVVDLRLLTPTGEVLTCSPTVNPEVFWGTAGGMGLTGLILSARIRLRPVETPYLLVDYRRARSLHEALDLLAECDDRYRYSVAWVDCLATGKSLGRAVLMGGNHAAASHLPPRLRSTLSPSRRKTWSIPFDLPSGTLNRWTVGAFNTWYFLRHGDATGVPVPWDAFFYPLDSLAHWNRLYGRRGFVQYQVALPPEAGREGLVALLERLSRSGRAAFLAVLKHLGEGNPGLLSFPMKGYTLAVDLPVTDGLVPFLHELDRLVLRHGGRVYLAKDASLTPEAFAAMYPNLERFRALKRKLDPGGVLSSSLARRLGIAGDRIVSRRPPGIPGGADA